MIRDRYHRETLSLAGMAAERVRIVAFLVDFPPALASAVAKAVEAAGGRASVEGDLAAVHLIDATEPDGDEGELAEVQAQLRALGTAAPGRAAQSLQTKHDELSAAIERRRSAARSEAAERAEGDLSSALAGDPEGVQALAERVAERPASFAEGLGKALADAPRLALAEVGHGALAGIML